MRRLLLIFTVMIACLLTACHPTIPGKIIQPGDMEDVLFDYHLALGMLESSGKPYKEKLMLQHTYKLAVLQKHGITEEQFEESMAYYMRHADLMHDIYEDLAERMEDEAMAQGVTASEISQYGSLTAKGDTADIWAGPKAMVLSPDVPFNLYSFVIKADTAFQKGDQLILSFNPNFIIQEGSRDALVVLAVKFANDSVASQKRVIASNMKQTIQIADGRRSGIKEVRGFFIYNRSKTAMTSTLKLLILEHIQLIRMHRSESSQELPAKDSTAVEEDDDFIPNHPNHPNLPTSSALKPVTATPVRVIKESGLPRGQRKDPPPFLQREEALKRQFGRQHRDPHGNQPSMER